MIKYFLSILLFNFLNTTGFSQSNITYSQETTSAKRIYSSDVNDSFTVYIKLPKQYTMENKRKFTTIYLLDANMYFEIVAAIVAKYNDIGIMPPVIIVGIGYKNFDEMEKLRTRDLLYPKAPAGEELENSGGGDAF